MKKGIFTLLSFCWFVIGGSHAYAKVWRVNNNAGVNADFTDFPAAVTGANAGDTIYLESSATAYTGVVNLNKKLIIIGSGYYLSGAHLNPYTEANPNPSTITYIFFIAGSAGSVVEGLFFQYYMYLGDNNITVERNNVAGSDIYVGYNGNSNNDTIRENVLYGITAGSSSYSGTNTLIYNNIITYSIDFSNNINNFNGYIINNDIGSVTYGSCVINAANFTLQNNILFNPGFGTTVNSNVYFNNIVSTTSATSGIPTGNANVFLNATSLSSVYVGWGTASSGYSPDGAFVLASGSPASGAGALNSTTVDCGAFGGPAAYVLSGMPSIPSIYALTAPTEVSAGTASINVTISSASH